MSDVQFEEPGDNEFHIKSRRLLGEPETPAMIGLLLKYKIARDEKQAMYILIGVAAVAVLLTFYIGFGNRGVKDDTFIDENGIRMTLKEHIKNLNK